MPVNLQPYFDFITETAYLAGRSTLAHFQTGVRADYKADRTPVTLADRAAEELVRKRIEERFPGHAIVGEEFGEKKEATASHRWFIDPIDGTKSFLRGVPLYAVLIGLEIEGRVEAGAAYFPALDEMLAAATGLGCWWNGRPARVSRVSELDQAWVAFTNPASFERHGRLRQFQRLMQNRLPSCRLVGCLRLPAGGDRARRGDARSHYGSLGLWALPTHFPRSGRLILAIGRDRRRFMAWKPWRPPRPCCRKC
jgi:fructose-1,6-bisphosphatase/inositol monophosphatase family enzyme